MIPLNCAGCGAKLEIGPDMDVFACGFCGINQKVERIGGTIALRRIDESIRRVQQGTDRTASELALPRLKQDLINAELEQKRILRQGMAGGKAADQVIGFGIFVFIGSIFIVGWWSILVPVLFRLDSQLDKEASGSDSSCR